MNILFIHWILSPYFTEASVVDIFLLYSNDVNISLYFDESKMSEWLDVHIFFVIYPDLSKNDSKLLMSKLFIFFEYLNQIIKLFFILYIK